MDNKIKAVIVFILLYLHSLYQFYYSAICVSAVCENDVLSVNFSNFHTTYIVIKAIPFRCRRLVFDTSFVIFPSCCFQILYGGLIRDDTLTTAALIEFKDRR